MFDQFTISKPDGMTGAEWNEQRQAARVAADAAKLAQMRAERAVAEQDPKEREREAERERERTARENDARNNVKAFLSPAIAEARERERLADEAKKAREQRAAHAKTPEGRAEAVEHYTAKLDAADKEFARAEANLIYGEPVSEHALLDAGREVATAKALLAAAKRRAKVQA